jgi:hypothetical protein
MVCLSFCTHVIKIRFILWINLWLIEMPVHLIVRLKIKLIQHVQILFETYMYFWYLQSTRKVILWPVNTQQTGQLHTLPSQQQHMSPHCGICIGFLVCLVVYSLCTSCKIQAMARGVSLNPKHSDSSGAHTAHYSVTNGCFFFGRRGGVKHPGFGADHSLVPSAVIKNVLGHTSSRDDCLHVCTGRTSSLLLPWSEVHQQ